MPLVWDAYQTSDEDKQSLGWVYIGDLVQELRVKNIPWWTLQIHTY